MTATEPVPAPGAAHLPALVSDTVLVPATGRPRDENPYWVYLARFSGESQRTMRGCLDRIAAIIGHTDPCPGLGEEVAWEQMRYQHALLLRTRFAQQWSLSHANKHLAALRGVVKEAWRLGLMSADDFERLRDVEGIKGSREPAGRNIAAGETEDLLATCLAGESTRGLRDAALIAVLQSTGIRRAEAASSLIERYDHAERSLKITGKGNKERTVYIHRTAAGYLDRWLAAGGQRRGPVFRLIDKWGHIGSRALSARSVGAIVAARREQAGLAHLSTHDFRRTFIGDALDAGADLAQVQQLAGHASPITTAPYDRRPARALRAAVDKLHLPTPEDLAARTRERTGPEAASS